MTSSSRPAGKAFRLAPSLDDQLTAERLARCVAELVDEQLNLAPIWYSCTEVPGAQHPPDTGIALLRRHSGEGGPGRYQRYR